MRSVRILGAVPAVLFSVAMLSSFVVTAQTVTEIIDMSGDGTGNTLSWPWGIAADEAGNVFVTGLFSDNAFRITPGGTITEIIDATGEGAGNPLYWAHGIAVDAAGNVFVTGRNS